MDRNMQEFTDLSAHEEQLLMSFADGECRWCGSKLLGRFKAQRLIARKTSARMFVDSLSRLHTNVVGVVDTVSADLWDRIESRSEQEERAAIYLGKRTENVAVRERESFWKGVMQPFTQVGPQFMWGASGAAVGVTASVLGLFLVTGSLPWSIQGGNFQGNNNAVLIAPAAELARNESALGGGAIETVALKSDDTLRRPAVRFEEPQAVQVEWMRSRGRVHVINDPREKSAIFWVRRKSSTTSPGSNSSQGEIRIIDNDRPSAITVRAR